VTAHLCCRRTATSPLCSSAAACLGLCCSPAAPAASASCHTASRVRKRCLTAAVLARLGSGNEVGLVGKRHPAVLAVYNSCHNTLRFRVPQSCVAQCATQLL
jgi:hypothetical protein